MGKRSSSTSTLKKERRKKRKHVEHRRKIEQKKQSILSATQLKNTFFLCDYEGSVFRFFNEEDHANTLAQGDVYLSTLESCRAYENAEQGDSEEAYETYNSGHAVGRGDDPEIIRRAQQSGAYISLNSERVTISNNTRITSLPDAYVLCTTIEFSPENINEEIGKFCVEIKNPRKFFNVVSRKIDSISAIREAAIGKIKYADRNYTGMDQPPGPIGFVKPRFPYEKQKEFRFLWIMENMGKLEPILINCPEIRNLCKRIA